MSLLTINIDEDTYVRHINHALSMGYSSLHEILFKELKSEICKSVVNSLNDDQLIGVKVIENTSPSAHSLKEAIKTDGYSFWYVQVQIDLALGNYITEPNIKGVTGIRLDSISYGNESKVIKFRHKVMKTRERYLVELVKAVIPINTLKRIRNEFGEECNCANSLLRPVKHGVWQWLQQFGCINCGRRYLCECFRPAVEKYIEVAKEPQSIYSTPGLTSQFLTTIKESEYREGICHLCTGKSSNLFFCHPIYGSPVRVKYGCLSDVN